MNKWKKWFARPAAAVLCTGVLALALSAVPALTLWLGDAGLLAQPHARTQKAGALALTGEDMYLTRVLKKYSRRGSLSGYQRAGTSPDSMYYVEPDGLLFHVEELASAGVLPSANGKAPDKSPPCPPAPEQPVPEPHAGVRVQSRRGPAQAHGMFPFARSRPSGHSFFHSMDAAIQPRRRSISGRRTDF